MTQSITTTTSRRRTTHGQQTRQTILKVAVDVASIEGLEGLSIGRLASELGMSKSGLFAHFGSKEELQLAVIDTAREIFAAEVIQPAYSAQPGIARLEALMTAWLSYGERKVFRGGCFFAAVAVEFDSRPGVVRDRIAELIQQWLETVSQIIQEAKDLGEVTPDVDAAQLAFELHTTLWGANGLLQLLNNEQIVTQTKTAITQRLQRIKLPKPLEG
ncbi:TetR/AcrR family transcriptional regulator [Oscillatoria sp. FACHB-1407]|uniref:TetR/AcrR family transcriptional regulator n=1 Tax=Oscillatoria sp. FACHB-1407 TaxID=2692847 RepID=UPI0016826840|nr:TetR/AcrR family transcriptional regulator [Oscillatoria sp. FACHB-1407]MBD2465249.1 TetR/AcrR family transcriptional regulator [Oscillatoria sp. FACHB-1407]